MELWIYLSNKTRLWRHNNMVRAFNCRAGPLFKHRGPLICNFFHFLALTKKVIEILTKICAKITIIVVENWEPCYFIINLNVKKSRYPYFLSDVDFNCWLPMSGIVNIRSMIYCHHRWTKIIQWQICRWWYFIWLKWTKICISEWQQLHLNRQAK